MFGNKSLPERLDIVGPKGQIIPNVKINLEYYVSKEEFRKMLYEDKLKYAEIIKFIGFPYDSSNFSRMVRKLGWKTGLGKVDVYTVNENFFKSWSRESAWVYGWLITDGHVNEKSVDLTLQKSDSDVIDKVKAALEFSGNKYVRESKETLRIYNRKLAQSLFDIGLPTKSKTFNCTMPNIPSELMWDFIRGAFEGDGSVSVSVKNDLKVSLCGASDALMHGIADYLTSEGITVRVKQDSNGFIVVHAQSIIDSLRWLYAMYLDTDESIRLNRKYEKFTSFIHEGFHAKKRKSNEANEFIGLCLRNIA